MAPNPQKDPESVSRATTEETPRWCMDGGRSGGAAFTFFLPTFDSRPAVPRVSRRRYLRPSCTCGPTHSSRRRELTELSGKSGGDTCDQLFVGGFKCPAGEIVIFVCCRAVGERVWVCWVPGWVCGCGFGLGCVGAGSLGSLLWYPGLWGASRCSG